MYIYSDVQVAGCIKLNIPHSGMNNVNIRSWAGLTQ